MSPLRWTSKSTYKLAAELVEQGFRASAVLRIADVCTESITEIAQP
jgi:hypothetical protein